MNYLNQYKSFVNSHYLTEGLRMTAGVILPALVLGYFGYMVIGIALSIGALMVSVTDSPGPVHHRRNGMAVCLIFIFAGALVTGLMTKSTVLLAIFVSISCFFFSMITIFGSRAASIGTASMIIITLTIDPKKHLNTPVDALVNALYVASGGIWYMCYSLSLYNFRPYRLAHQALGDCIEATAEYLQLRANLYKKNANDDLLFKQILNQQAVVQQKQNDLSELLFKTRSISKDSTVEGRSLVMMFLDLSDIFEKIMTSHQQYSLLHQYFDKTDILPDFEHVVTTLASDLKEVGIAVKSGEPAKPFTRIFTEIETLSKKLDDLRHNYLKPDNIEGFISLRRILQNIQDIADRTKILQQYSTYDKSLAKKQPDIDITKFIGSQEISFDLLWSNLTLKSDSFRHAIRVSIAVLVGLLVARLFSIGHSYWVLLTIIVILKPAYSLTKTRNGQRLAGTILGVLAGVCILYVTSSSKVLLALLILFMLGSFSTMRRNYFISVLFMTPYLVIFYHLLSPGDFYILLKDRVIDTIVGSVIAFAASYLLFPSWEKDKVRPAMITMLTEVRNYFLLFAEGIKGSEINNVALQMVRKKTLVALANLSTAFNRMMSEPESRQQGPELLHRFVVLNHSLTSYIAGFAQNVQQQHGFSAQDLAEVIKDIDGYLNHAIQNLGNHHGQILPLYEKPSQRKMNEIANQLLEKRRAEIKNGWTDTETRITLSKVKPVVDQLNLVYNVAVDIDKVSRAYIEKVLA